MSSESGSPFTKFETMSGLLHPFQRVLHETKFSTGKNTFILALSGGLDSVVLLDLLAKSGYSGCIAHVNYGLRASDSDLDEALARSLAEQYSWQIEVLDAKELMCHHPNESIQMAARRIRYDWFSKLLLKHNCQTIFLAHHADDQVETLILKLLRAGGIESLSGMDKQNGPFLRPLLDFKKELLLEYASSNNLVWREDLSNQSDKYLRNAIRLQVIPELNRIQPNFVQMALESVGRLKTEHSQLSSFTEDWTNKHVTRTHTGFCVLKSDLNALVSPAYVIHELLKEYGFSWRFCERISQNLTNTHKQHFQAGVFLVQLDRLYLSINKENTEVSLLNNEPKPEIVIDYFAEMPVMIGLATKNEAWLSVDKIDEKLSIRKWRKADYFYPSGMKGRKLLSDFFTDIKLLPQERDTQWILTCGNEVVWVVNRRIDRRFAALQDEKNVMRVILLDLECS
jgi:tRNA(Ile)-lysidine synthase